MRPSGIVTLLTDFGTADAYAGSMKGVILDIDRRLTIVDLTHDVPAQDVASAAWVLRTAFRYFPAGTVHVAVVDPGVGGARRAIAVQALEWYFVGPDNGVLSWALRGVEHVTAVEITSARYMRPDVSATFHGRDIFAPAAAHLAGGLAIEKLGPYVYDPVRLDWPSPITRGDTIEAPVVHVDRFGNLITSLEREAFEAWRADASTISVEAGGRDVGSIARTYADAEPGAPVAIFESSGCLEVAVRDGSAAAELGCGRETAVTIRRA